MRVTESPACSRTFIHLTTTDYGGPLPGSRGELDTSPPQWVGVLGFGQGCSRVCSGDHRLWDVWEAGGHCGREEGSSVSAEGTRTVGRPSLPGSAGGGGG